MRLRKSPSNQIHENVKLLLLPVQVPASVSGRSCFHLCSEIFLVPSPSQPHHPALSPGPHPLTYPEYELQTPFKERQPQRLSYASGDKGIKLFFLSSVT